MRTILVAGLAAILPALAQSPEDVVRIELQKLDSSVTGLQNLDNSLSARRVIVSGAYGGGRAVKNAPYSADAVTEITQTLGDGNRIEQRTTQRLYRDNDGRERREESVLAVGALAQTDAPRVITISDPMERITYSLDPQQRTARRTPGLGTWIALDTTGASKGAVVYAPGERVVRLTSNIGTVANEDLGTRNVEGVIARGTRTTETIPAGQVGNLLPIKVVDEVWYSPDLQMDVSTTHSDPRSGETVYKLTNIIRANPPRSLFEPPADYTVIGPGEGGGRGRGPGGLEIKK